MGNQSLVREEKMHSILASLIATMPISKLTHHHPRDSLEHLLRKEQVTDSLFLVATLRVYICVCVCTDLVAQLFPTP